MSGNFELIPTSSKSDDDEKSKLKLLIQDKSNRIELIEIKRQKSYWNDYKQIRLDNKNVDFIYCVLCKNVYVFNKDSTGANGRHNQQCRKRLDKPKGKFI